MVAQKKSNEKVTLFKESFEEHLKRSLAIIDTESATEYEKFLALSYTVRDQLIDRWVQTQKTYYEQDVRRVYYLSLEFLMGRALGNSIVNLDIDEEISTALDKLGLSLEELRDIEVDAGLGYGGLGRLAACFIDSMATLEYPAYGMGIRYEYGMFHQKIEDGQQVQKPDNWLKNPNPWEIARPQYSIKVPFGGTISTYKDEDGQLRYSWDTQDFVLAMPYDTPIPGYKNNTVNNLRLWSAKSNDDFGLEYFNSGDYLSAIKDQELSESISKVLYPNDSSVNGKELRLKQQYFLCRASLYDIVRRYKKTHSDLNKLYTKVVIQLNDTHPAIAIPELMRVLMDEEGLNWDAAWTQTTKIFAYTNHTLMPEALEKWEVALFEKLLPRHLQIIYEINSRFLRQVSLKWPGDTARLSRMSIIEEQPSKAIRMAFLSIVGSFSVNGVAALHSRLLTERLFKDFYELTPEKFNNKTNGITQRRWLRKANPELSKLIGDTIGDDWVKDLDKLQDLNSYATKKAFVKKFAAIKLEKKQQFADYLLKTQNITIDPTSMIDVHVKRIHEYKRQLLPALHAIHLYNKIKAGDTDVVPRTIVVGGKAAPGYWMAKQIIRFINSVAEVINNDAEVNKIIKVVYLENYRVSLAERVIPAAELSEQVSTAGTEASGTGNMKFALNGALTIGTLDGANVEIGEEVGDDNIFIFGKTVEEVTEIYNGGYNPMDYYNNSDDLRRVIDLIGSGFFSPGSPHLYGPLLDNLLKHDPYLVLADFDSYIARQVDVDKAYKDQDKWQEMAIKNVARVGKFSTDRTMKQYNEDIWNVNSTPIKL